MKAGGQNGINFGTDHVFRILLRLAPPVMIAQLIQALYNIVDSYFVGRYSDTGLTALSIIYPLQLLMIALAVGTGVGINTLMAHFMGVGEPEKSRETAGTGALLAFVMWALFAGVCWCIMPGYARMSTDSPAVAQDVVTYGRIVCVCSFGLFFESIWTKVLQAGGAMKLPMAAQIVGALVNIVLDPILIFGIGPVPELGIAGAAIATVLGQCAAACIVMPKGFRKSPPLSAYRRYVPRIYQVGFPNILMQTAYTFYILGLNLILKGFSDQAVTALGLYYKWQTFFFIPLGAMQTCIVPVLSYNFGAGLYDRCRRTLRDAVLMGLTLMALGTISFALFPEPLLAVFTQDLQVIRIGSYGFRVIGVSFLPMVLSLIFPVFFQAIGAPVRSSLLTVLRTVVLFVPLGWLLSRFGLHAFWFTFPLTELVTTAVGMLFYRQWRRKLPA